MTTPTASTGSGRGNANGGGNADHCSFVELPYCSFRRSLAIFRRFRFGRRIRCRCSLSPGCGNHAKHQNRCKQLFTVPHSTLLAVETAHPHMGSFVIIYHHDLYE